MSAVVAVTVFVLYCCLCYMCVCCESARVTAMLVWGPGRCGCGGCVYEWYTWFRCFV